MAVKMWLSCFVVFLALTLSGCSMFGGGDMKYTKIDEDGNVIEEKNPFSELPAKRLLTKGMDDYSVGKYYTAIEAFEEILNRYPFSEEAILAELKAADCSYYLQNYQEAEVLYENFENSHPTNESIPYVMFQKAMCNYRQIDRIDRDPSGAEKAVSLFKQLIKAFPNSPYISDARKKSKLATEFLANHEFFVVKFYVRTEKYKQAEARLRYLLAAYPDTAIARQGEKLLARLEAGEPPKTTFFSFLPSFLKKDQPEEMGEQNQE